MQLPPILALAIPRVLSRGGPALIAVALAGGVARAQVRPDAVLLRFPDISQDEIVFRYDDDLWLVPKEGGVARRITTADGNESFPKFSPDGKRLAFVGGYDGGSDLYTLDLAAGAPLRVSYHPDQELFSDWTPDGSALIYSSSEVSGVARAARLLRVPAGGGEAEPLPVPYGTFGSIDPSGTWLAYTPYSSEFRTWKRYRGGHAGDIWLYNLKTGEARNATNDPANDQSPMWYGSELFFASDRGAAGSFNLYSMDLRSGAVKPLTDFREVDVRFPSVGPEDIVFEAGGKLYRIDLKHPDRPRLPIDVALPGERPALRAKAHDVSDLVEDMTSGPSGARLVLEARGDLWSVPVEGGATRNLTASAGVAERAPAWSPDGQWIACISDRTGEYEVTLLRADGKGFPGADERGQRTLTELGPGWKDGLHWSPDSKKLVIATSGGALLLLDVESRALTQVHENPEGFPLNPHWSADSGWLTWSHRHSQSRLSAIYLYDVAQGEVHEVTSGMFDDGQPSFDLGGEFLFFTSTRTFDPLYADLDGTWIYANSRNLCAMALRADVEDPFAPENHEEEGEALKADEDEKDKDEKDKEADDEAQDEAQDEAVEPLRIDLEGLESRTLVLAVPAGNLAAVQGGKGKVLYYRGARTGAESGGEEDEEGGPSGASGALVFLDLKAEDRKERVEKTILRGDLNAFTLTARGDKIAVATGAGYGVVKVEPDQELKPIDLSGMVAVIDPRAEWEQLLRDAWRLYRDFFYDPDMHGLDWDAVLARYQAALPDCTSRADVHDLIGEMMAELNVGHAYNSGPPAGLPRAQPARQVGLLGCDWKLENGAYRIARVLGSAYDADARSPLAALGVAARPGDYLLAVNGLAVDARRSVHAAFEGTALKPTMITLCAAPRRDGSERDVLVQPLESETELRYRDWVAQKRTYVEEHGGGRIGYVHVPSTGVDGQNELMRQFLAQQHKDALLIDERWNSGGQIPDRFVELLDRPLLNLWAVRQGEDWSWPPIGHRGPKAMLINYAAGSGGDCFPYYFRQAGLGKLIGTRTWGGLVGISGNPSLIDGATPTVPRFAFYELDGTWGVEGYGVAPDIEVVDDPSAMRDGSDPQLDAAIAHLSEELARLPRSALPRPAGADRRGVGVRPEDR
jgi:tricorn protease